MYVLLSSLVPLALKWHLHHHSQSNGQSSSFWTHVFTPLSFHDMCWKEMLITDLVVTMCSVYQWSFLLMCPFVYNDWDFGMMLDRNKHVHWTFVPHCHYVTVNIMWLGACPPSLCCVSLRIEELHTLEGSFSVEVIQKHLFCPL
jgi:hypothetical protein